MENFGEMRETNELRQHRTIWQERSAKDFASYESYKRAGILYVFPPFITARMGQKIGRRPQTQLCGDAQELYLPVFVHAFWKRILDTISMFQSLFCTIILAVLKATHSSPNANNNDIYTDTQRDNSYFRTIVRNSIILYRRDCPEVNV